MTTNYLGHCQGDSWMSSHQSSTTRHETCYHHSWIKNLKLSDKLPYHPGRFSSPLFLSTLVSAGCLLPCSCRGWPAVSCRSWLCDKVNLFPWNCSVTGVSGWATRLCGPAMDASWAIFTTSPPVETQNKSWTNITWSEVIDCYTIITINNDCLYYAQVPSKH